MALYPVSLLDRKHNKCKRCLQIPQPMPTQIQKCIKIISCITRYTKANDFETRVLHVKVLQQLESVDHWQFKKKCVLCILQSAHFEYTKFFSSLITSSSCSVLYLHWQFFCVSVIPSGHNPQPAIRCHSSRGWSKKHHGGNIQVGSFQQIKLVRHFQVLVWVCLKMKEQSNSHVTFWFQNLEIVSFLGVIDFDTSKGYNLSTCISRIWVSGSDLQIDHTNLRPRRSQRVNESMNRRIGGTVAPHPLWHSICNTLRIAWCLLRIPQSTLAVERWPITRLWAPSELICLHAMQHFVTKLTLNDRMILAISIYKVPLDSRISVALGVTSITPSQNLTRIGGSIAGTQRTIRFCWRERS